jgi:hypothetical protein
MRIRSALISLVVVTVAVACSSPHGPAPISPATLVHRLLTTPIAASTLPAGLPTPTFSPFKVSANSIKHHSVGAVDIEFNNPDQASIVYVVFASRRDAVADFRGVQPSAGEVDSPAPSTFPRPSVIRSSPYPVGGGISGVEFVNANTLVLVSTVSVNPSHGDVPTAIKLAKTALQHLAAVAAAH